MRSVGDAALAFKSSGAGLAPGAAFDGRLAGPFDRMLPRPLDDLGAGGNSESAPELTRALRAGLDDSGLWPGASGHAFGLAGIDPFDFFEVRRPTGSSLCRAARTMPRCSPPPARARRLRRAPTST